MNDEMVPTEQEQAGDELVCVETTPTVQKRIPRVRASGSIGGEVDRKGHHATVTFSLAATSAETAVAVLDEAIKRLSQHRALYALEVK